MTLYMTEGTVSLSRLLEFLTPGIIHGLGNSLFAIHGNAQVMGEKPERERSAILDASLQAQHMLEVLRCMSGQGPMNCSKLDVCAVLPAICDACKVSMRDFGVAVSLAEDVHENRCSLDVILAVRSVGAVMLAVRDRLPSGYEGTMRVSVVARRNRVHEIRLELVQKPSFLPFPVDIVAVREDAAQLVGAVIKEPGEGEASLVRIDVRQA